MRLDLYTNPDQDKCIRAVGLDPDKIPRLRGASIQKMPEDFILDYCIVIHTRTGAGNRGSYEANKDNINHIFKGKSNPYMRTSPYYYMDCDDKFDNTYVDFFYTVPDGFDCGKSYSTEREHALRNPKKAINEAAKRMDNKPEAIIIDIDGTVALRGDRDYADYSKISLDWPNNDVIDILGQVNWGYYEPIIITGRNETCAMATKSWIEEYMWFSGRNRTGYQLHMRPKNDRRPDYELKKEIYERFIKNNYKVVAVFEDRTRCVEMWRKEGLTCLQVADGNY